MLYVGTKGQLSIDPWGVGEQELSWNPKKSPGNMCRKGLKFPCLSWNIDGSARTAGTFSRAFVPFLAWIDTFQGPPDKCVRGLRAFIWRSIKYVTRYWKWLQCSVKCTSSGDKTINISGKPGNFIPSLHMFPGIFWGFKTSTAHLHPKDQWTIALL